MLQALERLRIWIDGCIEALVLALVCLSPWAFGAVTAEFEFFLYVGLAAILLLWAIRVLLEWRLTWTTCPVALCLAGLVLSGVWQITPLSKAVLSRVSPSTAALYDQLLPREPEVLPLEASSTPLVARSGATISFCPGATRTELIKLLFAFVLFAVVRNRVASHRSFRRLSVLVLANGALLSLFALIQSFSSQPDTLYWIYPSHAQVFGPFVNRNHFAFYANLCIGLGVGLLLSARGPVESPASDATSQTSGRRKRRSTALARSRVSTARRLLEVPSELLQHPGQLWISAALVLIVSSVAFCLSRGGWVALLAGTGVCLLLGLRSSGRRWRWETGALVLILSLALLTWLGLDRLQARLTTTWTGKVLDEDRLTLLVNARALVADFPVWGTGYGTFSFMERLHFHAPDDVGSAYEHAHNEYLEMLIEGGLVGITLIMIAVALIFWLGYRACRIRAGQPVSGLALGALFAFTTMLLHSFVEFGVHIPAIALLATVIGAQVCALGSNATVSAGGTSGESGGAGRAAYGLRLFGLAPLAGAALAVVLALFFYEHGRTRAESERLRLAAFGRKGFTEALFGPVALSSEAPERGPARRLHYLDAAARLDPDNPRLQVKLAEAYMDVFERQQRDDKRVDGASFLLACNPATLPLATAHSAIMAATARFDEGLQKHLLQSKTVELARKYVVPSLRHFVRARDLCPLLAKPHVRIAANRKVFRSADPRHRYLARAKLLVPADPELWYLCGMQELADDQPDEACSSWRRSLELSNTRLSSILQAVMPILSPDDILGKVLPDKPEVVLKAALELYPLSEQTEERRPFLVKALTLLEQQPAFEAGDLYTKATVCRLLGRAQESLGAYQSALRRQPYQAAWRFELAQLFFEQRELKKAQRELLTVLAQQPGHSEARKLLEEVRREIAKRM